MNFKRYGVRPYLGPKVRHGTVYGGTAKFKVRSILDYYGGSPELSTLILLILPVSISITVKVNTCYVVGTVSIKMINFAISQFDPITAKVGVRLVLKLFDAIFITHGTHVIHNGSLLYLHVEL